MKTLTATILATCMSFTAASAFAVDPVTKSETKKSMSIQDCKDRLATAKGEKRNDAPVDADTEKMCADMMKNGTGKSMKKHDGAKTQSAPTQEQPAAPMK